MASTEQQSLLDLTDKETREKLSLWDRRPDAMAPLTDKQTDSVLEIRAAAEMPAIPSEVSSEASLLAFMLTHFVMTFRFTKLPLKVIY